MAQLQLLGLAQLAQHADGGAARGGHIGSISRGGPAACWKFTSRFTSMQNLDVMDMIHIRFTSMQKWLDFAAFSHLESHPCRIWR